MILVATHCWAVNYPHYADLLAAQLTSLTQNDQGTPFGIVVTHDIHDERTCEALSRFWNRIIPLPLETNECWRRSIARDRVVQEYPDHDLYWFADCDYLALSGCLGSVYNRWEMLGRPALVWPRAYSAHPDKYAVDSWLVDPSRGAEPDLSTVIPWLCSRAIGGVQFVSGDYVRQYGYLRNDRRYQTPPSKPFPDTKDDAHFRRVLERTHGAKSLGALPSLVRLRHTAVGYGRDANPTP